MMDHQVKIFTILPYLRNLDGTGRDGEDNLTDEYD